MSSRGIQIAPAPGRDCDLVGGRDRYRNIQEIRNRAREHSDDQRNVASTSIFTRYGAYVKDFRRVPDPIRDNGGEARLERAKGKDRLQGLQEILGRAVNHSSEQRDVASTSIFTEYGAYFKDFKPVSDPIRDNDGEEHLKKVIWVANLRRKRRRDEA